MNKKTLWMFAIMLGVAVISGCVNPPPEIPSKNVTVNVTENVTSYNNVKVYTDSEIYLPYQHINLIFVNNLNETLYFTNQNFNPIYLFNKINGTFEKINETLVLSNLPVPIYRGGGYFSMKIPPHSNSSVDIGTAGRRGYKEGDVYMYQINLSVECKDKEEICDTIQLESNEFIIPKESGYISGFAGYEEKSCRCIGTNYASPEQYPESILQYCIGTVTDCKCYIGEYINDTLDSLQKTEVKCELLDKGITVEERCRILDTCIGEKDVK